MHEIGVRFTAHRAIKFKDLELQLPAYTEVDELVQGETECPKMA